LEQAGFRVQTALRGDTGLEKAKRILPDLIVLDLMLPQVDGIEICKILKQNNRYSRIPIIMLTAKGEETDRIVGLELGADDYMTKPFSPKELVARIKAVLRRVRGRVERDSVIKIGLLTIDSSRHIVKLKDKTLELTSKEYDLLLALIDAQGRVLSREFLLETVWGYDHAVNIETRTVDMHIGQLRRKLKAEENRIVTVKNVGYRFDDEMDER
jgi:two-component system alkaline phosphatase synthesis response regulator PhoP